MENLPLDFFKDCPHKLTFDLLHVFTYMEKWLDLGNKSVPREALKNLKACLDYRIEKINQLEEE